MLKRWINIEICVKMLKIDDYVMWGDVLKLLKTSEELVVHMKEKNIKFNIINEEDAKKFLENSNYYMKMASYRENFTKHNGKYVNLEFAYLQELSHIDKELRYLLLMMCLDIEHAMKTRLLFNIENNPEEDGYNIIRKFINKYERSCQNINKHKASEYCRDLIEKYYSYFPAWVFVELISFGDMVKLYEFYSEEYQGTFRNTKLLYAVRDLRNATAHSNCLLINLHKGDNVPSAVITQFVSRIPDIGASMRKTKLSNKFIYDFVTLLYVYNEIVLSEEVRQKRFNELREFFDTTVIKNKEYFKKNECIKTAYNFMKKIIDFLIV